MTGMRKRRTGIAVATFVVVLLLAIGGVWIFSGAAARPATSVPTSWARVVRTDVVQRQQVSGTLDYSGNFAVANPAGAGVATWLPAPGTIVRRGGPLYALDRLSARLLYGNRPASRDLSLGVSDGADIRELQENLLALGFLAGGASQVNGRFDVATLAAVEEWQRALNEPVTGTLPLGSVVFLPAAVRVGTVAVAPGAAVQSGGAILSATSASPAVLVPLDPGAVSQLALGDSALVSLPDGTTVSGRVSAIGRVATAPSSGSDQGQGNPNPTPTVPVTISLADPHGRGGLDQAPVQVAITEQEDRHVLAVPISALLAQPGGGYAVKVAEGTTTRLVGVTPALFDDVGGRVEVSGAGIAPGRRVEVPSQ
jgi:peptidoglycan hydrolase-like protein with peptidoglycan-binding domain